ncbi:MAG: T9SS type A sorting domain-containing protein, partial [Bacteroidales bacterium]|nr:T9SS type A sorting domain-containing protein [Bacteroidales bacterium]
AGGVSEYVAHKEIRLLPGFHAEAGSYFRAHIEPCMGCSEVQSSFIVNNPINEDGFSGIYDMLPPLKRGYAAATDRFSERETASVRLYPNPNNGSFTIETNFDPQEVTTVQIYNSLGQLSYSQAGLPQAVITVPGMSKGLFVVKITTATDQFMLKMVMQ